MIAARWLRASLVAVVLMAAASACGPKTPPVAPVAPGAPRYPDYPMPDVPPSLAVTPALRNEHLAAWQRLQAGDLRASNRQFAAILKQAPAFYPAETGLGYALLADRQFKAADAHFAAAIARNDRYLPALSGQVEAALGMNNAIAAIAAMERVLVVDPKREAVKGRLELLRFRQVQTLIDSGRKARLAKRYDEAQGALDRALTLAPTSAIILRELAQNEVARGALDEAEGHARRAVQADANDVDGHAILAAVYEAQEKWREASLEWARAVALEPRPEWRERVATLKDRADMAALPPEYRELPTAATFTRALAAAYIGIKLDAIIDKAPRRVTGVVTDIRNHWASTWILPVTQAGVMDILPNHTFQPGSVVRRGELAQIVSQLLPLTSARPADVTAWRASRPRLVDLPTGNVFYRPAAFALASGAMNANAFRFEATRPATGAELMAVVARIEQLARP